MSLLGIDIGTSGCKAATFAEDGTCYVIEQRSYNMLPAEPGICELDSVQVWEMTMDVIKQAAQKTPTNDPITALSVSSFGEAVVPVTREKKILAPSILSCDKRGESYVSALRDYMNVDSLYQINPNILSPNYTLPKLMWIKANQPDIYEQADYFLLWADFVCFMLGGPVFACNSLANRTLLFDINTNDWCDKLLNWSGIAREKLGKIVPGGSIVGTVSPEMANALNLPQNVTIVAGGHDQCPNALGSGCINPGDTAYGIGTYECITPVYSTLPDLPAMLNAGMNIEHHVIPERYVSFLFNQAGMLLKWFRNAFAQDSTDNNIYAKLDAEIPDEISDILAFPYFEATGSPHYINDAKGAYIGLTTDSTRGDMFKALLEGITFYFVETIENLKNLGIPMDKFIASGGGAKSDKWLQIKADILNAPVIRPKVTECSTMGAAMLAGIATDVFTTAEAVERFVEYEKTFEPNQENHKKYQAKQEQFVKLFNAYYKAMQS